MQNSLNIRIGDLELRYTKDSAPDRAEIVHWTGLGVSEYCYVLVFFDLSREEGYSARFVSDRPFLYKNPPKMWEFLKFCQNTLNAFAENFVYNSSLEEKDDNEHSDD